MQRNMSIPCVDSVPSPGVQGTRLAPQSVLAVVRMELFAYSIGTLSVDSFCGVKEKVQETHKNKVQERLPYG